RNELVLRILSPLPAPLGSLEWPIYLRLQSEDSLKTDVVTPLLRAVYSQSQQIKELVVHLNEKDHVISKLLDKLDSSGTDISAVFPGVTGNRISRRPTDREHAARHVKGLGIFDETRWKDAGYDKIAVPESIHDIVSAVDSSSTTFSVDVSPVIDVKPDWWSYLDCPTSRAATTPVSQRQTLSEMSRHAEPDHEMNIENDDFERQATPPNLKTKGGDRQDQPIAAVNDTVPANSESVDDETTEDEDDLDGPSKPSTQRSRAKADITPVAPKPEPKKLGKLGAFRPKAKELSPMEEGQSTTELESRPSAAQEAAWAEPAPLSGSSRVKLGRIDARRAPSETPEPTSSVPPVSTQTSPRKLGKIGCRKTARESSATPVTQTPVPEPVKGANDVPVPGPIKEETEEEMAKRRREELKRTLEAKSSAPAKKKRKF
ncbi:hypothetical protein LTS18_009869, partial [Coniosporium uncinatum]